MKIRHSITLWVAGAGLVSTLFLSLVSFFEMQEQPYKLIDSELTTTAAYLENILATKKHPGTQSDEKLLALVGARYWARVYDQEGQLVFRSELSTHVEFPFDQIPDDHGHTVKTHLPRERIFLNQDNDDAVAFRVKRIKAGPYRVEIAKPMESLEEEVFDLAVALAGGFTASSVLLIVLSYLVAGRIVKPISVINTLTKEITDKTLDTRLPLGQSQDEIFELTRSLNRMFDRLDYSFTRQKQFLANASHELKTPIAMLRLFFDETAQRQDVPETIQQQMESQSNVVLRMERLVKTLLELSVLGLHGQLELEEFDLITLGQSVTEDFSPLINGKNLSLTSILPATLTVLADKEKIRRLLINLFDNAVKYNIQQGKIVLEIRKEDHSVTLLLSNTYPRIPQEELSKVFDQFYRLEKSRSLEYGGAGLGLVIAKEIIRLHGGQIVMESGPGDWIHLRANWPTKITAERVS